MVDRCMCGREKNSVYKFCIKCAKDKGVCAMCEKQLKNQKEVKDGLCKKCLYTYFTE